MAFYHSLNADMRRERPVDELFAKAVSKDLLTLQHDCSDPNMATVVKKTFISPEAWKGFPGQPIIGSRPPPQQKAPWMYGEAPDLLRLIGNATPGYGS